MSSTKNPVLLGEAPKGTQGFAFDWNAWTTMRFAEAVGFNARFIFKYFRPLNLLDDRQETGTNSYDAFDHQRAVQNVGLKIAAGDRVICVGSRVTRAVSEYFGINVQYSSRFIPMCSWGDLIEGNQFAQIPHPANPAGRQSYRRGLPAQPKVAISFLIATVRERYSDAFQHRLDTE
ncbi:MULTISPECIES: hypothetical protein [Thalassospira]|uniref:Uncharacterized protein n=1 Tax=Thalassospira marina TaxID=2048283 RepID=A0A2N3KIT9_9PROT|nr:MULTISPECIES: hypothetical protein [Thalassospira]OSQ39092.1 hypothetical protein THS27_21560 [Thalassospira sp. MCCC 1A01428]PKR50461.1 hypothetical protein COO20_21550 [Thalassospira marina]|tara:strand:- start:797 stop:1324 length:528 start_codon:yes stop_codon:yes gene_type:complete